MENRARNDIELGLDERRSTSEKGNTALVNEKDLNGSKILEMQMTEWKDTEEAKREDELNHAQDPYIRRKKEEANYTEQERKQEMTETRYA